MTRRELWDRVDALIKQVPGISAYSIITVTTDEMARNASQGQYRGLLELRAEQRVREMMLERFEPKTGAPT